jgi:hypothetical protein
MAAARRAGDLTRGKEQRNEELGTGQHQSGLWTVAATFTVATGLQGALPMRVSWCPAAGFNPRSGREPWLLHRHVHRTSDLQVLETCRRND